MHTSSDELAEIATEIKPGLVVMTHLLLWGRSEEELIEEVEKNYEGEIICANDLDIFILSKDEITYGNLLSEEQFED